MRLLRFLLLAAAAASLAGGLWAGLERIGWVEPAPDSDLLLWHGPLMAAAFFATLIGLERAVALGARWLYLAPLLSAAGGLLLIAGGSAQAAATVAAISAAILAAGAVEAFRREPALYMGALALGVFALLGGNLIWAWQGLSPNVALWWAGFLLLVIAGERLELSRILAHGRLSLGWFAVAVIGIVAALLMSAPRLLGASLLLLTAWLFVFDIARRTAGRTGLTRFMAVALLAGYAWLGLAGGLLAFAHDPLAGYGYDAVLHAIFIGFAFSMVFAHAPIIFPALTGVELPYRPFLYLPLLILHLSLAVRLEADLLDRPETRAAAGATNAGAILLFFALLAVAAVGAPRSRSAGRAKPSAANRAN